MACSVFPRPIYNKTTHSTVRRLLNEHHLHLHHLHPHHLDSTQVQWTPYYVQSSPDGVSGEGLAINMSQVQIEATVLPSAILGKLFTHVPLSPSSIIWYWPMDIDAQRTDANRFFYR